MAKAVFKDKFIAFIDILGFKAMIEAAERGEGRPLGEIRELLSELEGRHQRHAIAQHGPTTCPHSAFDRRDLDLQVTQVSDCAIISAEVSPAGVINLVNHCWGAAIMLLTKGVMVRGYITRGRIYHEGSEFYGTGYHEAYQREAGVTAFKQEADEKGTPFVEVDPEVCAYVRDQTDECVREMFGRFTKHDGEVTALFPFKRLVQPIAIGGSGRPFDPEHAKQSNDILRKNLHDLKARIMQYVDPQNPAALRKTRHYIDAIDQQLDVCDATDRKIDGLCQPAVSARYPWRLERR